ncbi:unnamed protein product [Caenorhabditis bovis]|uniref:RRM domain-containing protein n=1 Tax=Caenorhabditis bovis TaxID=2654633 RepID=A0A8S1F9G7_9PELO|nr:unnamed protein product [Caenorhabditis bovis]
MSVIIRLQNLPLSAAASDVRAFFSGLKIPDGAVHIVGGPEGDVFIGFASDEDARQAMKRDRMKLHNSEIRLLLSSKTEMNAVIEQAKAGYFSPKDSELQSTAPLSAAWNERQMYPPQRPSFPKYVADDTNKPAYARMDYAPRRSPPRRSPPRRLSPPRRSPPKEIYEGGYIGKFDTRPPYQPFEERSRAVREETPENGLKDAFANLPPHLRPPHGIPPPHMRHLLPPKIESPSDIRKSDSDSWRESRFNSASEPPVYPTNTRAPLIKTLPELPKNGARKPLLGNGAPPFNERPVPPQLPPFVKKAAPPTSSPNGQQSTTNSEKYYIELTRLPNDLLSPANLEEFIKPSTPLTLSSAKVVFGPGGIHVHTIVRLESRADMTRMLSRDGEMGIKIRESSKRDFDDAIDGVLPLATTPGMEDENRPRRRRSPEIRRSRSPPRRRRSRERSRRMSPDRSKRRRSRSPRSFKPHTDLNRWCVQITNVPFKCKEDELQAWFAQKVKPAKLVRTHYADGNASDRWIAEFSSQSLMRRAMSIKGLCSGRTLRLQYIDNDLADELMRIEDVYGAEKKQQNEALRDYAMKELESRNHHLMSDDDPQYPSTSQMPLPPPPTFFPRGPQRGVPPHMVRGGIAPRAGYHGYPMRGMLPYGGGMYRGNRKPSEPPTVNPISEMARSLGPPGTVVSCSGFPRDVTLEDVLKFFDAYNPDHNSVRIRRGDDGLMTGECMLALDTPEHAIEAAKNLNGATIKDQLIKVEVPNV